MKIFTAIWDRGNREETILCTKVKTEENVIFLYCENNLVGQFDMGALDHWFVRNDHESQRRGGASRGGRGAGSECRKEDGHEQGNGADQSAG